MWLPLSGHIFGKNYLWMTLGRTGLLVPNYIWCATAVLRERRSPRLCRGGDRESESAIAKFSPRVPEMAVCELTRRMNSAGGRWNFVRRRCEGYLLMAVWLW